MTRKIKNHEDHKQRTKCETAKVGFFSAWALIGLPSNFCWELHKKGEFESSHGRSTHGKQADGARKTRSLVAQGRWSLFAVQFLYETDCTRKSGRWKQVVHYSTVVAEARFYCMYQHNTQAGACARAHTHTHTHTRARARARSRAQETSGLALLNQVFPKKVAGFATDCNVCFFYVYIQKPSCNFHQILSST